MVVVFFALIFYFLSYSIATPENERLNEHISYYEPLIQKAVTLRSANQIIVLKFVAFDRNFTLFLSTDKQFSESDTPGYLVTGQLLEDNESYVYGSIVNGMFEGVIRVPEETYFVEPATVYFVTPVSFPSVIFKRSDISDDEFIPLNFTQKRKRRIRSQRNLTSALDSSAAERSGKSSATICGLRIIVDHVYFQKSSHRTYRSIISKLTTIISSVSKIFESIDFNRDGKPDGVSFKITDFIIWWTAEQPGYKMSNAKMNSREFLDAVSTYDSSDVCLVLAVTARSFENKVHGLAYGRNKSSGGICATTKTEGRFTNVAMVSLYRDNVHLSDQVARLMVMHQFGHSFGARHDPDTTECSPKRQHGGHYAMSASVPLRGGGNGQKFSPCSLRDMSALMNSMGTPCFTNLENFKSCGNGFVDSPKEECDCGTEEQCVLIDECCATLDEFTTEQDECRYRKSKEASCSDREDKCCNGNCQIVSADERLHCNREAICKEKSYCDGVNKNCPWSANLAAGTKCRGDLGTCQNGVCQDVVCKLLNLEPCTCESVKFTCYLCCSRDGLCVSASHLGLYPPNGTHYLRPDGESCDDGDGFCISGFCRVLSRALTDDEELSEFKSEQNHHFHYHLGYVVLVVVISNVIVLILSIGVVVGFIKWLNRRRSARRDQRSTQTTSPN